MDTINNETSDRGILNSSGTVSSVLQPEILGVVRKSTRLAGMKRKVSGAIDPTDSQFLSLDTDHDSEAARYGVKMPAELVKQFYALLSKVAVRNDTQRQAAYKAMFEISSALHNKQASLKYDKAERKVEIITVADSTVLWASQRPQGMLVESTHKRGRKQAQLSKALVSSHNDIEFAARDIASQPGTSFKADRIEPGVEPSKPLSISMSPIQNIGLVNEPPSLGESAISPNELTAREIAKKFSLNSAGFALFKGLISSDVFSYKEVADEGGARDELHKSYHGMITLICRTSQALGINERSMALTCSLLAAKIFLDCDDKKSYKTTMHDGIEGLIKEHQETLNTYRMSHVTFSRHVKAGGIINILMDVVPEIFSLVSFPFSRFRDMGAEMGFAVRDAVKFHQGQIKKDIHLTWTNARNEMRVLYNYQWNQLASDERWVGFEVTEYMLAQLFKTEETVVCLSPYFYSELVACGVEDSGIDAEMLLQYLDKGKSLSSEKVYLFPCCIRSHWFAVVIAHHNSNWKMWSVSSDISFKKMIATACLIIESYFGQHVAFDETALEVSLNPSPSHCDSAVQLFQFAKQLKDAAYRKALFEGARTLNFSIHAVRESLFEGRCS